MNLLGALGMGPTEAQLQAEEDRRIARLRWAFDGEDRDSFCVNLFLDTYEFMMKDSRHGTKCSLPVAKAIGDQVDVTRRTLLTLEDLAAVRVEGQGRWFTDKGGPDYAEPSSRNPQEN